jgi:hypothetical protein
LEMYAELSQARSVDEIVKVTRDYLARCTRAELERLPASCRPGEVRDERDIEDWADRLTSESGHAMLVIEDERTLARLTHHFLIASVRLRQLARAPS